MPLSISPHDLSAIRSHAARSAPEECCGILLGAEGTTGVEVAEVVATPNATRWDRCRRFEIAPEALAAALDRARRRGWQLIGFYHSHPAGDAELSDEDRRRAWIGTSQLVVAGPAATVRCWRRGTRAEEWREDTVRCLSGEPAG